MELLCKGRGAWGLALGVKVGGRRLGQLRQQLSQVSALRPTTWRVGATTGQVSAAHGTCFIETWPNHTLCWPPRNPNMVVSQAPWNSAGGLLSSRDGVLQHAAWVKVWQNHATSAGMS
jgi:hypothetical protein